MNIDLVSRELYILQSNENDGRGVSCVRSLAMYISRGDIDSAKAATNNDWDKIRNYEAIAQYLKDCGLANKEWV